MASIVLTGLSANNPTPGQFEELNFAAGPASGASPTRTILIIANKTTAGTGSTATVYGPDTSPPCQTEADVISLSGTGSEAHRMWLKAVKAQGANPLNPIYLIFPAESAGVAASLTTTIATVPTKGGTWRFYVNDEYVEYSFATGDTLASITAGMVAAINSQSRWPVTSAQATSSTANDSVALTARIKGPRGNFINTQSALVGSTGITVTNTTRAFLTSGATADSNSAVLTAINPLKFDYIISSAEDATQFGAVVTQVNSQALPLTGIRQRAFCGAVDTTISNVNTIATGLNAEKAEIIWQKGSDWTPAEVAAFHASLYAYLENSGVKPRLNFSLFPTSANDSALYTVPGPRNQTAATSAEVQSALANGVTPIGRRQNGSAFIWKRITTRSLNGAVADYRIRDAHKVCVSYFFADAVHSKFALQFGGKDLVDDPKQGGPPVDGQTVSPALIRAAAQEVVTSYGNLNLVSNPDAINSKMVVQRESNPTTRVSLRIPLTPVDILDQIACAIDQVA